MSNTPIDRGSDCTALAKRRSELVRVWGDGSIEAQRAALLRVLRARKLALARQRLQLALRAKRDGGGLAGMLRELADGVILGVASKVAYNEGIRTGGGTAPTLPITHEDASAVLLGLQMHAAADELEEPGEN